MIDELDKILKSMESGRISKIYSMKANESKVPIYQKYALTIPEAAEFSNIGQNAISKLLNEPRCPFVLHVGKKRLIKREEFVRYLDNKIIL